jgi:hypothetical protein
MHLGVEAVQLVGSIQRQAGNSAVEAEQNGLE